MRLINSSKNKLNNKINLQKLFCHTETKDKHVDEN